MRFLGGLQQAISREAWMFSLVISSLRIMGDLLSYFSESLIRFLSRWASLGSVWEERTCRYFSSLSVGAQSWQRTRARTMNARRGRAAAMKRVAKVLVVSRVLLEHWLSSTIKDKQYPRGAMEARMVTARRKNSPPFEETDGFRLLQQILQTHPTNTKSRMHEVRAPTQLHTNTAVLKVGRLAYLVVRQALGQVPTAIDPEPMKPVLPQLASITTRMTAAAAAKAEKISSQKSEHPPTVLFSYYPPIVIIFKGFHNLSSLNSIPIFQGSQRSGLQIKCEYFWGCFHAAIYHFQLDSCPFLGDYLSAYYIIINPQQEKYNQSLKLSRIYCKWTLFDDSLIFLVLQRQGR